MQPEGNGHSILDGAYVYPEHSSTKHSPNIRENDHRVLCIVVMKGPEGYCRLFINNDQGVKAPLKHPMVA